MWKEINLSRANEKTRLNAQNEIDILAMLNHANIITYYNHFVDESALFIEMEYANGKTLSRKIVFSVSRPKVRTQNQMYFPGGSLPDKECFLRASIHTHVIVYQIFFCLIFFNHLGLLWFYVNKYTVDLKIYCLFINIVNYCMVCVDKILKNWNELNWNVSLGQLISTNVNVS